MAQQSQYFSFVFLLFGIFCIFLHHPSTSCNIPYASVVFEAKTQFLRLVAMRLVAYPPEVSDVCLFLKIYMDPNHLQSLGVLFNGMYKDEYKILMKHIDSTWDEGAKRTVYMHFYGFPNCWSGFISLYYFSLRDVDNHLWMPMRNYSAYAVWCARQKSPWYNFF